MTTSSAMPNIGHLDLSDSEADDLFASPSKKGDSLTPQAKEEVTGSSTEVDAHKVRNSESRYDTEEAHEAYLRKELESVRSINQVMEGVVESLERAKGNMETVSRTVTSASTLLDTWIRILSQTEHNQRLILNPSWHGASRDAADMENESILQRQRDERRQIEEAQRQEAATRRAEDEERRRTLGGATRSVRGSRGTGRGYGRGTTQPPPVYKEVSGQGSTRGSRRGGATGSGRTGSGIGRGLLSSRARGRGV